MNNKSKSILSTLEENNEQKPSEAIKVPVEYEIECPRCHDVMTLKSDFDRFCYFCEECCFTLSFEHF